MPPAESTCPTAVCPTARPADDASEWLAPTVLACSAAYGAGGMGRHFAELIELARRHGALSGYFSPGAKPGDVVVGHEVKERRSPWLFRYTPLRFSAGWKAHFGGDWFDAAVARHLPADARRFIGFNGQALRSFRRAGELGYQQLGLVAATAHVSLVAEQDRLALARYPIEAPWLNDAQRRKTLAEYERANVIYVGSSYSRESFERRGVPGEKIRIMDYKPHPRFVPPRHRDDDGGLLRIVYTGSVTVTKGVPVLLDALARLSHRRAELHLVGGTQTRGMRRYMQQRMARDPRIRMAAGDPLPVLHRADVYVHPSFQDGFGYAPMEALACGVPVIVTEDTGMKEHVRPGVNGYVVPTGDLEALVERIEHFARHPLTFAPTPPAEPE